MNARLPTHLYQVLDDPLLVLLKSQARGLYQLYKGRPCQQLVNAYNSF
jgi:hypothetical protein